MTVPGQRFEIDLSDVEEEDGFQPKPGGFRPVIGSSMTSLVRDITERLPSLSTSTTLPQPPKAAEKKSEGGFPAHKKRTRPSAFKAQNQKSKVDHQVEGRKRDVGSDVSGKKGDGGHELDRRQIDQENKDRLAKMSEEEIEHERRELLEGLSPSLVKRFLQGASLDSREERDVDKEQASAGDIAVTIPSVKPTSSSKKSAIRSQISSADRSSDEASSERSQKPSASTQKTSSSILPPAPKIHFPAPPSTTTNPAPLLDPSSPDFLDQLHSKYFPSLPTDPTKLAWMTPAPTDDDADSPYSPNLPSVPPSAIRFDFRGLLLPPRTARAIPTSKGLHHHGDAPEAAGYTIPELARLARSAFPAQRCMAFQTLGRILYRLGKNMYGDEGTDLVVGLWRCVEDGVVLDTLTDEAGREGGHLTSKTLATEALWLWQRGGGKRWKAV
ncbi:MAG: hypothetical protein M1816_004130 [Peltula sp. TS41687]|nr:MAG: hypothetical protein M1816_004130 [Peltula sp. TS41687]